MLALAETPAEYEAAAGDAFRRGDCASAFRIGQRFRTEHPDHAAGYWVEIAAAAKPPCKPPESDADLQDLAEAVREIRRRKLEGWDHSAVMFTYRHTFHWRAKLAQKRGDFANAITVLEKLKALGDPRSRAIADIDLSVAHLEKYLQTNEPKDATAAGEATKSALSNKAGLTAEGYDDRFRALLYDQLGIIEYHLDHKNAAVSAFESAVQLDRSNQMLAEHLRAARSGDKRWLSLRDLINLLSGD